MKGIDFGRDVLTRSFGTGSRRNGITDVATSLGALAGGMLIGSAMALLLAPKAGRELREDIRRRVGGSGTGVGARGTATRVFTEY